MLKVGIIGVGGIARGVHIPKLEKCSDAVITAVCDTDTQALQKAAELLKLPGNRCFTDYRELIACEAVDAVEICTPNDLHAEMAAAVILAGKPVNVEKPVSDTLEKAAELQKVLEDHPVPNMTCFSYRFFPAVRYARSILERKMIGDVVSFHVEYLKDSALWKGRRMEWRFDRNRSGGGVSYDLGAHLIDMSQFLLGDMKELCADTGIVIKRRQLPDSEEWAEVTTDDYCSFLAKLQGDIPGEFIISRAAVGHRNTIKFDIYGTEGVLSFDLNHPEELNVCIGEVDRESFGLHKITVPGRYRVDQEQTFVDLCLGRKTEYLPDLRDGIRTQKVLEAIRISALEKRWVTIE